MLFIHGGNDSFVPTPMVYELYKAKKGVKKLLVVPNATHARSFAVANNDYKNTVKQFIEEQNWFEKNPISIYEEPIFWFEKIDFWFEKNQFSIWERVKFRR